MNTITNSSGQVPQIPNLPTLIDETTPLDAYKRTGFDGEEYELAFSDEFNTDGRTFWPGDDPYAVLHNLHSPKQRLTRYLRSYWEAVDLHYVCPCGS